MLIEELTWDSKLFKRKIGKLNPAGVTGPDIRNLLNDAARKGFQYILCKVSPRELSLISTLESIGFYLSDVGIVFEASTESLISSYNREDSSCLKEIRIAREADIPSLLEMAASMFTASRFYNDPFFSRDEADLMFQTWIKNSVTGSAADICYVVPDKGFITGKKTNPATAEIPLIGVSDREIRKGVGTMLLHKLTDYLSGQKVNVIRVRTQLRNIEGMNFYIKSHFVMHDYDLVFAKILS